MGRGLVGAATIKDATGRQRAVRKVNNILVETYWEIGWDIVRWLQEQRWSARLIERLSADLRSANPGAHGLSARNLQYMTSLAAHWPTWPTGSAQDGVAQLAWSLVTPLLDSYPDRDVAEFYSQRAVAEGWTHLVLPRRLT